MVKYETNTRKIYLIGLIVGSIAVLLAIIVFVILRVAKVGFFGPYTKTPDSSHYFIYGTPTKLTSAQQAIIQNIAKSL